MIDGIVTLDLSRTACGLARGVSPAFVAGPENRLVAHAVGSLLEGASTDSAAFSPLVLVGPAGSGKSQLVQAIVRRRQTASAEIIPIPKDSSPQALAEETVAYFTAADFTRDLLLAVHERTTAAWRRRVRSAKVLVIEDLEQFLHGSPAQEELRFTIDAIRDSGALLAFTADREPASLTNLEPGLRDRLCEGLVVRINRPGRAAREGILRLAAQTRGIELSDDDVARLARRDVGTAAQLLGKLNRHAHVNRTAAAAGAEIASSELLLAHEDGTGIPLKQIIAATARYFAVPQAALLGPSRRTSLVKARNVAVHLARQLTTLSYADIGRGLGNRDHTTIMHAERRIQEQTAADPAIQRAVEDLNRMLR